jgi:hypothetical protein
VTPEQRRIRELELELELAEAEEAEAAGGGGPGAESPTAGAAPSWLQALGRGAGQGVTLGFGDEVSGAVQALMAKAMGDRGTLAGLYRSNRDSFRRENAAAESAHKGAYLGGTLLGGLATAPLMPGVGGGKTAWQAAKAGAKLGAATGAAYGLGAGDADLTRGEVGGALGDATLGGLLGGALGGAVPLTAAAGGWMARNVGAPLVRLARGGYVKPTPEANRLAAEGVELTLGRMDPASALGRFEELAASKATGGSLKALRSETDRTARDALLKRAAAPGAPPPTRGAAPGQQIEEIARGFGRGYEDALGGAHLWPERYMGQGKWKGLLSGPNTTQGKGAFEMAAMARDIDASPAVRRRALAWLKNEAESLAPLKSGPDAGRVDAKSVQALRTRLRDRIRRLGGEGDDRQLSEIYGRAEKFVSELLEGQLPPENAAKLRSLDASYRNLFAVDKAASGSAAFRTGEGGEFTAAQLLEAIRQKGATPELKSLALDANKVLTTSYPLTGVQGVAGEVAPLAKFVGPAFAHASNVLPGLRRHALNPAWTPGLPARALTATGRAIEGAAMRPRATTPAYRSLYDLLTDPRQDEALQLVPR